jgi:hypothetical protein
MKKQILITSEGKKYQLVNDTAYSMDTPEKVIEILEWSRDSETRLILDYGDTKTGKSWHETNDIIGHVGRSTGSIKIPLLIQTARSMGGGGILDGCILRIRDAKTKNVLYKAPNYQQDHILIEPTPGNTETGYTHKVTVNGELFSRHKSERSAKMLLIKIS